MKNKTLDVLNILAFIVLLPFTYIANKLADLKSTEPPPEQDKKLNIKKTTYPDGWTNKPTTEDFNNFFIDIHKQLN